MDPLSITASVITLIAAAESTSKALRRLLAIRNASTILQALMNELTDFRVLLDVAQSSIEAISETDHGNQQVLTHLETVLQRGTEVITNLKSFIESRLVHEGISGSEPRIRKRGWLKQDRLLIMRQELSEARQALVNLLTVANTAQLAILPRLLLSVQNVTVQNISSTSMDNNNQSQHQSSSSLHFDEFSETTSANPLKAQSIEVSQQSDQNISSLVIQATAIRGRCMSFCPCCCHEKNSGHTPLWLKSLFGVMSYQSTGTPVLDHRACDWSQCRYREKGKVKFEYWFPTWFVSLVVSVSAASDIDGVGARCSIRVPDYISDRDGIFAMIAKGDDAMLTRSFMQRNNISARAIHSRWGESLLHYAVSCSRIETCRMLVEAGADWSYRHPAADITTLEFSWRKILGSSDGGSSLVKLRELIEQADAWEAIRVNALHRIVTGLSNARLEEQIELNPMAINDMGSLKHTPLLWAIARQDYTATKLLLDAGAKIDAKVCTGYPAIRKAVDIPTMQMLLNVGADINASDYVGVTALWHCVLRDQLKEIQFLIRNGADVTIPAWYSPLVLAASRGSVRVMEMLLDNGAEVDQQDDCGYTAVMHAVANDQIDSVTVLVSRGARLDVLAHDGGSILTEVAKYGTIHMIRLLTNLRKEHLHTDQSNIGRYWKLFERARGDGALTPNTSLQEERAAFEALLVSLNKELDRDEVCSAVRQSELEYLDENDEDNDFHDAQEMLDPAG